jgi:hypothetical protein
MSATQQPGVFQQPVRKITMTKDHGFTIKNPAIRFACSFMVISLFFIPFAVYLAPWFEWSDGCEHAAAIRELTHSLLHPLNPYLNLPGQTSPRYVLSIVIMAIAEKIFTCDVFTLLGIFSVIAFIFLGLGIYLFAKEYFQDENQPLFTLLSLLFFWGRGWDGADSIMFSSLVYNAYYPSVISLILAFYALTALLKYLRQNMRRYFIAFVFFGSLVFLNHQPTGFLFFFMAFLLVVTEGNRNTKEVLLFIISFAVAVMVTAGWPYYSFCKGVVFMISGKGKQFWDYQAGHRLHYSGHLLRIGPCFLGMLTVGYYGLKKQYPFLVLGFAASFIFYALGYLLTIILFERLIFLCILFSQLAFSRMLKNIMYGVPDIIEGRRKQLLQSVYVFALCIGIFTQFYLIGTVYMPHYIALLSPAGIKPSEHPMQKYIALRQKLHRGDVVMADVLTSWVLPCATDVKVISLYHNSPFVLENFERLHDTRIFFHSPADRERIITKYNISHVLVNKTKINEGSYSETDNAIYPDKDWMHSLARLGTVLINNEDFFLVALGEKAVEG